MEKDFSKRRFRKSRPLKEPTKKGGKQTDLFVWVDNDLQLYESNPRKIWFQIKIHPSLFDLDHRSHLFAIMFDLKAFAKNKNKKLNAKKKSRLSPWEP